MVVNSAVEAAQRQMRSDELTDAYTIQHDAITNSANLTPEEKDVRSLDVA